MSLRGYLSTALSRAGLSPDLFGPAPSDIPYDVRTIVDGLELKPSAVEFCCCPRCYCCYPIDDFPDNCTHKEASDDASPCGKALWHTVRNRSYATRRYLHHDLKRWIGKLMRRPGLEDMLDKNVLDTGAKPGELRDIWNGEILREFQGADKQHFLKTKVHREGRFVFALNMDAFNPFQNLVGSTTNASTAMYMVCLNLPPDIRHRVENVFLVGIIPSSKEPSLTQINHFLKPLVDELLLFWNWGVYYSRTFKHAKGRLIRCALVPVVCDTPAARQLMAFGSHSSTHFCPYCGLTLNDIDNLDTDTWPPGIETREQFLALAEQWRDTSSSERKKLFDQHGVRYTELLRLPYWDPVKFIVIDSMHALLLGNLQTHCRQLWGMDIRINDKDTEQKPKRKDAQPTRDEIEDAWELLRRGTEKDIGKLKVKILRALCEGAGLRYGAKKNALLTSLIQLVSLFSGCVDVKAITNDLQRKDQGWVNEKGESKDPFPERGRNAPVSEQELRKVYHAFSTASSAKTFSRNLRKKAVVALAESLSATDTELAEEFAGDSLESMKSLDILNKLFEYVSRRTIRSRWFSNGVLFSASHKKPDRERCPRQRSSSPRPSLEGAIS